MPHLIKFQDYSVYYRQRKNYVVAVDNIIVRAEVQPKADERLNITVVTDVDQGEITQEQADELADDLMEALEGNTQKPLKEINVEILSGTDGMLADTVAMRCLGETDFIIFEEPYLMTPMSSNFGVMDEEKLKSYFPEAVFYQEDGNTLGMLLYDGKIDCRFADYCGTGERCWVFVTPVSENAAVSGEGSMENDAALQAIQYLNVGGNH